LVYPIFFYSFFFFFFFFFRFPFRRLSLPFASSVYRAVTSVVPLQGPSAIFLDPSSARILLALLSSILSASLASLPTFRSPFLFGRSYHKRIFPLWLPALCDPPGLCIHARLQARRVLACLCEYDLQTLPPFPSPNDSETPDSEPDVELGDGEDPDRREWRCLFADEKRFGINRRQQTAVEGEGE
jgi:hypothetical protein